MRASRIILLKRLKDKVDIIERRQKILFYLCAINAAVAAIAILLYV